MPLSQRNESPVPLGWCQALCCGTPRYQVSRQNCSQIKDSEGFWDLQWTLQSCLPPVFHSWLSSKQKASSNTVDYSFRALTSKGAHFALTGQKVDLFGLVIRWLLNREKIRLYLCCKVLQKTPGFSQQRLSFAWTAMLSKANQLYWNSSWTWWSLVLYYFLYFFKCWIAF